MYSILNNVLTWIKHASGKKNQSTSVTVIHLDHVDKMEKTPAAIMEDLLKQYSVPEDKQVGLSRFT